MYNQQVIELVTGMVSLSNYLSSNRHEKQRALRQIEEAQKEIKRLEEEESKLLFKFAQADKQLNRLFMFDEPFRFEVQGQLYLFQRDSYFNWQVTFVSNVTLDALLEDEVGK